MLVPAAVAEEIQRRGPQDPAARAIATTPWLKVVPTPMPTDSVRAWDLGQGETSVLAWAIAHPGSVAILDDLAARRCAKAHSIPQIGTLGIVLRAKRKRKGQIPTLEGGLGKSYLGGGLIIGASPRILESA